MPRHVLCIIASFLFVQLATAEDYFSDCVNRTSGNATFILTSDATPRLDGKPLPPDVEIAAFSPDGVCSGVGTWDGSNLVITIWGKDTQTSEGGISVGEQLVFHLWNPATETELNGSNAEIVVTYDESKSLLSKDGRFADGAILHANSFDVTVTDGGSDSEVPEAITELTLHAAYPNPAYDVTTIDVSLPTAATVLLEAFDLLGRCVASIVSKRNLPEGRHTFPLDVSLLPSGVYFLRLKANGRMRSSTLHVVQD